MPDFSLSHAIPFIAGVIAILVLVVYAFSCPDRKRYEADHDRHILGVIRDYPEGSLCALVDNAYSTTVMRSLLKRGLLRKDGDYYRLTDTGTTWLSQ